MTTVPYRIVYTAVEEVDRYEYQMEAPNSNPLCPYQQVIVIVIVIDYQVPSRWMLFVGLFGSW